MAAVDSLKYLWPTMHGREDYTALVQLWTDSAGTVPYVVDGVYGSYVVAVHTDDDTSSTDAPLAYGTAGSTTHASGNQVSVTFSAGDTEIVQEAGATRLRMDLFGIGPDPFPRVPLVKGVTRMYKTVPVAF